MGVVIRPAEASDLGISNKMPENPEIWKAVGMLDHFEKIQKLKDKIDGVPNFRRVPGYKVFVCGQPTKEGFAAALEKACGDKWPKDGPLIWLNMRQEPILYVNGNPVCARPPNKIGEYAELGDVTRESVEKDEAEFRRMLKKKAEDDGGKLKVVDVSKKESEIEAKEIMSLTEVIAGVKEKFPGLNHVRIPICNSANPLDRDFDALCATLVGSNVNCPVIVNCQVGLSRSTTGSVAACLFREFQLSASYEGLIETVPGVNLELLRMDKYELDPDKDVLFRGEFEVVKELMAALPDGAAAKRECDKGTGIKQLRENIAESKLSYEIMDDAAQAFLKTKTMDNIQKYVYLICFTGYLREQSKIAKDGVSEEKKKDLTLSGGRCAIPGNELKLPKSFAAFCEESKDVRAMVDNGKGNLQWERDIPPAALSNLENLAKTDFKSNLGKIIHDIYLTGHNMFKDMPQGDHKKRAKYRFASKTLMRILPNELKAEVETLIDSKTMTMDLYEILGQCTWGQGKSL